MKHKIDVSKFKFRKPLTQEEIEVGKKFLEIYMEDLLSDEVIEMNGYQISFDGEFNVTKFNPTDIEDDEDSMTFCCFGQAIDYCRYIPNE